jgi:cytoskeleton protein RodZ
MNTQASRRAADDLENNAHLPSDEEFFLTEKASPETPVSTHRPFASETPGAQIKAIREAQKISVEEVAKRLYLDVQMIKNLEADNYAHLPPPIFVQGYLRAFAKLFNVSDEPLLAAYLKYNPSSNHPPALASENTAQMPKMSGGHPASGRWWFYVTWILLLGLTALIAWRYAMQAPATHTPDAPPIENSSTAPITPPNISTNSITYTPPFEGGGTKPSTPSTTPAGTSPTIATTPPPIAMTSLPTVTGSQPIPPSNSGTMPTSPTETATTPSDAGTTPTPPVAATSDDASVLVLKFKDVSWARVLDSKGKKLHDGTSKPGQTVTIKEGVPPYEISLNKVTTVDVFYKGQLMDLKPFKDQRTPTFTVGEPPKGSVAEEEEEE